MNRLYTYLLLLVCLTWISCSSSDNDRQTFQVKMAVSALGEEKEYTLKEFADPTDEITIESTQPEWVSVDYYTNTSDQLVVVVTVDENSEELEREHQILLKAQNGNQLRLDITQKAPQFYERSFEFAGKGESRTVTLEDFTPPVVATEGINDWLQLEWKSASLKDVTIIVKANPSGAERSAQITLKDSQGNRTTLQVTQQFMQDDSDATTDQTTDQEAL